MNIYHEVSNLISYALKMQLIESNDINYIRNQYFDLLQLNYNDINQCQVLSTNQYTSAYSDDILNNIYTYITATSPILTALGEDVVKCKIMNILIPLPSVIHKQFDNIKQLQGMDKALDWFYHLSVASNYIKVAYNNRNCVWSCQTQYGNITLTINLAKPEKDSRQIAQMQLTPSQTYPTCSLCIENEGFAGNQSQNSRFVHRIIPLQLNKEQWYFQFSPYMYYNYHSIILNAQHRPMQININTFHALFDFVDIAPNYIIGANADLPIVGGSILNHDHFQAGIYTFPMEHAIPKYPITWNKYPQVQSHILQWPMSVIKLHGSKADLLNLSTHILDTWLNYSDTTVDILNQSSGKQHNTLNPILRKINSDTYQLYLILRNNITSAINPDGVFHSHQKFHHIKKENIGIIEAMGLAILPGRLQQELELLEQELCNNNSNWIHNINSQHILWKHKDWIEELLTQSANLNNINLTDYIKQQIANKFIQVMECCGVFKSNPLGLKAWQKFITACVGHVSV